MPSPRDILMALRSTLYIRNEKYSKMTEGSGLQTSQGFDSHYSAMQEPFASVSTDKAADVPETEYKDRKYQTNIDVGLPSSLIGDGITPPPDDTSNKSAPPTASKIFFAKEQSIPGLPPPPEETPRGIPSFLHGKIPGLPGLSDTSTMAPPAPQVSAAPPPEMSMQPQGPDVGAAPPPVGMPPGGDPNAMGVPGGMPPGGDPNMMGASGGMPPGGMPPGGDPNMMAMGAPGAPVDIDPITGLPIRQPSEIGRIYELKKIYSRLTTIEAFLSDTTDQDLIEVRNVIAQAIEFFEIVTSNLQAYKDKLDNIIVMFYDFLDQAYSMMAEYFKEKKESFDKEQKEEDSGKNKKNKDNGAKYYEFANN
jgi:hypothetical protein